jgi:hypothetical protein
MANGATFTTDRQSAEKSIGLLETLEEFALVENMQVPRILLLFSS